MVLAALKCRKIRHESSFASQNAVFARRNSYASLVLLHITRLPVLTATHLHNLAIDGSRVHLIGSMPSQQTGYMNFRLADPLVEREMQAIQAISRNSFQEGIWNIEKDATSAHALVISSYNPEVRRVERTLYGDSTLTFLVNQSDIEAEIRLKSTSRSRRLMRLDAATGDVEQLVVFNSHEPILRLSAHQSMFIVDIGTPESRDGARPAEKHE